MECRSSCVAIGLAIHRLPSRDDAVKWCIIRRWERCSCRAGAAPRGGRRQATSAVQTAPSREPAPALAAKACSEPLVALPPECGGECLRLRGRHRLRWVNFASRRSWSGLTVPTGARRACSPMSHRSARGVPTHEGAKAKFRTGSRARELPLPARRAAPRRAVLDGLPRTGSALPGPSGSISANPG